MRIYVAITGVIFGLLTVVHIWRAIEEGVQLVTNPWYLVITVVAAALCLWAMRLLWGRPRT